MYPTNLDYKMPAEWVKHSRTYIAWPVQSSMCYPEDYDAVCLGYAEIVHAIAEFEPVTVVANPADSDTLSRLFQNEWIESLFINHNDAWLRDNGPTFLIHDSGEVAGVNWQFNAWGGKYPPWDSDDQVAPQILKSIGSKCFNAPLVMEGGSFHVDGEGTLLTTEQCLLNPNRNPNLTKEQIEAELKKFLNVRKVVWLKNGLDGDETDGHIDNIACFVAPGKILIQICNNPEDENYLITQENLKILGQERDALGREFNLIPIQQPPKLCDPETDKRYTLSYLNFYYTNGGIIMPVFGGEAAETDRLAVQAMGKLFPERRIRTVNGRAIIREGGNVHCTTQQMPEGVI